VANIAIPPPGGQIFQVILKIGAIIVADVTNCVAMAELAKYAGEYGGWWLMP
jgi:hypothetical protein